MSDKVSDDVEYAAYSEGEKKEGIQDRQRSDRRRSSIAQGQIKHNKLGWKRLTVGDCDFKLLSFQQIRYYVGPSKYNC